MYIYIYIYIYIWVGISRNTKWYLTKLAGKWICEIVWYSNIYNRVWNSQCTRFKSLTLKMRSLDVDDLLVNMHMFAKIGASRPIHLFLVTFHDGCTYVHMNGMPHCIISCKNNRLTSFFDIRILLGQCDATKELLVSRFHNYFQPDTLWYLAF